MYKYGQYCPIAKAVEILGDRWTLLTWGARWAFEEPEESDLDPVLLMWWMRSRVQVDQLPQERVVVRFDFTGTKEKSFWLVLTKEDVSVCLTDPGFDLNVLVTADLATFFQIWLGRTSYDAALKKGRIEVGLSLPWPRPFPPGLPTAWPRRLCGLLRPNYRAQDISDRCWVASLRQSPYVRILSRQSR